MKRWRENCNVQLGLGQMVAQVRSCLFPLSLCSSVQPKANTWATGAAPPWEGAFLKLKPTRAISGQQLRKGEVLHWGLSRWGGRRQTGTSGISDLSGGTQWGWETAGLKQGLTEAVNQAACFSGLKTCHHAHDICHSETKSSPHRSRRGTLNIFLPGQ